MITLFEPYFKNDTYDTLENAKRSFLDIISLGSRWYFVSRYVDVIVKARSLSLKGLYDDKAWAQSSYNVLKSVEACGGKVHIMGLNNLRSITQPVVFISNHMSVLETFLFPCMIAPLIKVTYVVKDSLITHPLFGPVMKSRDPIVVSRTNPREDFITVMTQGKELLDKGISVIIFPQSTRTAEFIPEQFNSMGIKLAKEANVPVVPIAIKTDFWENGKIIKDVGPIKRKQPIYVKFSQPITINGAGKAEHKAIIDFISENLKRWNEQTSI
ncbi:lysophospholipid acyltransferase family protein [Oxobacter pfennigii]|uniref:lysophospholipid acyltransferase family protein n=1 Tax=Oxobacter pfennigii TaxID=36849 RepID=UPI003119F6E9